MLKKMYSDSSFFKGTRVKTGIQTPPGGLNVFGFGGTKIKRIRIRRDIDISQKCYKNMVETWENSIVNWDVYLNCGLYITGITCHPIILRNWNKSLDILEVYLCPSPPRLPDYNGTAFPNMNRESTDGWTNRHYQIHYLAVLLKLHGR